jgi:hypothetical protein
LLTLPVETHMAVPELHEIVPVRQGFAGLPGVQVPPPAQGEQAPLLHTWPEPQTVPLPALPVATHVDCPLLHDVVPVWQKLAGVPGVQGVPAVHGAHPPLSQTSLEPQDAPFATGAAPAQTVLPVAQDVAPTAHTFPPGLQTWPAMHAPHWPPWQTLLLPQAVPSAA